MNCPAVSKVVVSLRGACVTSTTLAGPEGHSWLRSCGRHPRSWVAPDRPSIIAAASQCARRDDTDRRGQANWASATHIRPYTVGTYIGLLASCGLGASEAIRLTREV